MPYLEVRSALNLVKQSFPKAPHWPQLPQRGSVESFVRQYLTPLDNLHLVNINEGETPFFYDQESDWLERMERFYDLYLKCQEGDDSSLSFFSFPPDSAEGFYAFLQEEWKDLNPVILKGQVSGPLSLGLQVSAGDNSAAFYNQELRDILTKSLSLTARAQVRELKKLNYPVLIFFDEPALLAYGQSSYVALSRSDIYESLREVVLAVKDEGAYCGIHSCSGVDWSILFDLPLDVVNFDAYSYFDSLLVYTEEIETFLKEGGCLGWGIVPSSEEVEKVDARSLKEMFSQEVKRLVEKGVSEDLLLEQYILTPSCGVSTVSIPHTERIYHTASELHKLLSS